MLSVDASSGFGFIGQGRLLYGGSNGLVLHVVGALSCLGADTWYPHACCGKRELFVGRVRDAAVCVDVNVVRRCLPTRFGQNDVRHIILNVPKMCENLGSCDMYLVVVTHNVAEVPAEVRDEVVGFVG